MTKHELKKYIERCPIFLDGATGSNLQKAGMPFGVCPEKWITENENVLIELQREYIKAGSDIIYAPTFGANSIKLKEYGLESEAEFLNKKLVEISKKAADNKALVAGDITMCGQTLKPLGALSLDELISCYEQQIKAVCEAGADLIVIETMMSLQETRAALIASANVCELPVMVTMTFGEGGKTLYGTDARTAAIALSALGADAVGINCSTGPDKMIALVQEMREVTNLPIIAKPNAGLPQFGKNGETVYDMNTVDFAAAMKKIAEAGAEIFGGCCGTSPEYIKMIKSSLTREDIKNTDKERQLNSYITSERQTVELSEIKMCRIDTLNDSEIKDELDDMNFDTVYDLLDCMEDEEQNTVYLCTDGNEDPMETMKNLLTEVLGYTTCPVCFETQYEEVLQYALIHYPGVAAVLLNQKNKAFAERISKIYGAVAY